MAFIEISCCLNIYSGRYSGIFTLRMKNEKKQNLCIGITCARSNNLLFEESYAVSHQQVPSKIFTYPISKSTNGKWKKKVSLVSLVNMLFEIFDECVTRKKIQFKVKILLISLSLPPLLTHQISKY